MCRLSSGTSCRCDGGTDIGGNLNERVTCHCIIILLPLKHKTRGQLEVRTWRVLRVSFRHETDKTPTIRKQTNFAKMSANILQDSEAHCFSSCITSKILARTFF